MSKTIKCLLSSLILMSVSGCHDGSDPILSVTEQIDGHWDFPVFGENDEQSIRIVNEQFTRYDYRGDESAQTEGFFGNCYIKWGPFNISLAFDEDGLPISAFNVNGASTTTTSDLIYYVDGSNLSFQERGSGEAPILLERMDEISVEDFNICST